MSNYERELGEINARLESMGREMSTMFKKMDKILEQGCPVGWQLRKDTDDLKGAPKRNADLWARVVAIISGLIATISTLKLWTGGR